MLEDLIRDRLKKLEEVKKYGNPYPARTLRTIKIKDLQDAFNKIEKTKKSVIVTGRLAAWRNQGKIIFGDVKDETGKMQVVISKEELKEKSFNYAKSVFDVGDFIEVKGLVFKTKRGEQSIKAKQVRMIAKCVRPWPSTWFGLENEEERYRRRYLDLNINPEVKELFMKKSKFWQEIRSYMLENGFLEVELPILEPIPGGAEAEPFITHHNALDVDFYLRISLELPLKKLLVGGYEKVFEIGRIFRNEGIDREHLQDYTQMEYYWAYADYNEGMKFVEKMYKRAIKSTLGTFATTYQGKKLIWSKPWKKVEYFDVFKKYSGIDLHKVTRSELFDKAVKLGAAPEKNAGKGRLIDLVFKKTARPELVDPCFLINPPVEIEPLAKRLESDPARVERFQVIAAGTELGKGFSELNDPQDQRERFEEQMRLREAGDAEAQMLDESYLEAMEYGMPPNTGFGMSERLFAILVDKPVRECVFFPLMRPLDRKSS